MRPVVGPRDRVIRLPDGRFLGYAEYGDPAGSPLINCHGGLTCRLDIEPADGPASRSRVRIVSPDRPGVGLSSRRRGRRIGDWAEDVRVLADQLGIERFGVFGWSFGGPFAAAVAALLPERAVSTVIVAGGVPFTWPCAARGFENRTDEVFFRLSEVCPPLAYLALRGTGEIAARAPRLWMRLGSAAMAPRDIAAIERDGVEQFADSVAEGLRCPGGAVDDYLAYDKPWGFDYEWITGPVHLWQGEEDTFLPVAWSQEAERRIPNATLTLVPNCGHFVARDSWDRIFQALFQTTGT
ncbi:MAG TPA: alpha/beta hydrolase [Acidimicrobiales bacterium]|nr:alpha/beta hydrolase [Acidimicrobiales bacterium]